MTKMCKILPRVYITISVCHSTVLSLVRREVFPAVTMKNVVFWDIKPQFVLHRRHITSPLQSPAGQCYVRFEVFTAVTMENVVFCISSQRPSVASYSYVPSSPILVTLMMEALSSSETSFLQEPHGVTSQKTAFFIVLSLLGHYAIVSVSLTPCFDVITLIL
jgi:hypothetical protein